jgi:addiction module RelB/DinJ family antitoxin
MDDQLKKNFEFICDELGMNMSTAITIFAKTVCREQRIPFEISLNKQTGGELNFMNKRATYEVCIYPEYWEPDNETFNELTANQTFYDLESAFSFLREQHEIIYNKMLDSNNDELLKSEIHFALKITNLDSHTHIIKFDYEGLSYIKDGVESRIDSYDDDDKSLFSIVYGFVKCLHI